jgi:hypothetical protein
MNNLIENSSRGLKIFGKNILIFIIVCLCSSILAVIVAPNFIRSNLTEQAFNEQLQSSGNPLITGITFSYNDVVGSLLWVFQASIVSLTLLIVSYIVKYVVDKKLFRINRWRDWKFFLYTSALALIEIDIFQNLADALKFNYKTDFVTNLVQTLIYCLIMVIFSSILLPKEKPPIEINIDKI